MNSGGGGFNDKDKEANLAFEQRVDAEADRLRVKREAQRILEAEDRGDVTPNGVTLTKLLAAPDEETVWRVDGLMPIGGRVLLAAQYKAGKTTLRNNLLATLLDGVPFLGAFPARPIAGRLAVLDTEMSVDQSRTWLRAHNIRRTDDIVVYLLRGQAGTLNFPDRNCRANWAARLREDGVSFLILDCLRPVLDAIGLDEHRDGGRFLTALDALLEEAEFREALVIHHMGHNNERARGDSRFRDWPDAEWRLVRQGEDPDGPRFFSAYGRDVEQTKQRLDYEETARRVTIAGGSRQDSPIDAALEAAVQLVAASPPSTMSGRAISEALKGSYSHTRVEMALTAGVKAGRLHSVPGPRNAKLYSLPSVPVSGPHKGPGRSDTSAHVHYRDTAGHWDARAEGSYGQLPLRHRSSSLPA